MTMNTIVTILILLLLPSWAGAQVTERPPSAQGVGPPARGELTEQDGTLAAPRVPSFAVEPGMIVFDSVLVGTSVSATLVIANAGRVSLRVDSVVTPAGEITVDPPTLSVRRHGSDSMVVTFAPLRPGMLAGSLLFYHNAPHSPDTVGFSGTAVGRGICVLETPEIEFGLVAIAEKARDTIIISNAGWGTLRIDSVRGTFPEISADAGPLLIGPGETGRIAVTFVPVDRGFREGEVRIWHSGESSPAIVGARGVGIAPAVFILRPDSIVIAGLEPGREALRGAMILNAGGSPLKIDSIACAVEGFEILLSSLEIAPGDSAGITIRFVPPREGMYAGEAFFYHTGVSGISSIALRGEARGIPSFTVGKTALAFGPTIPGQTRRDSLLVSNDGTTELLIDSVVSSAPEFSVQPGSARLPAGSMCWFIVDYHPQAGGTHVGSLQFWHTASNVPVTVGLEGTAVALPAAPVPAYPFPGQSELPGSVTLLWRHSPEATAYRLELSADPSFVPPILNDSLGLDTSLTAGRLAYNTTYYWKVAARNIAGWGAASEPVAFRTAGSLLMSTRVPFPAEAPTPASYRLVGIPGTDALTVAQILGGEQKIDWRMYRDNGAAADYLVELSGTFPLSIGEGYWVLKRDTFTIARNLSMPEVEADGTTSIPLHPGPNIITNPFDRPVAWADVVSVNGNAVGGDLPQTFDEGTYRESATLDPFTAYYIRNYPNLPRLKIPYPFHQGSPLGKEPDSQALWTMQVAFEGDINADRGNILGVASGASAERDDHDRWKPAPALGLCYIAFVRRDLDERFPYLRADIRPTGREGQVWDLEVRNPRRAAGSILVEGVDQVPAEFSVVLVTREETSPVDLRKTPRVALGAGSEKLSLRIIIGSPEYTSDELARLVPEQLALLQNYPNPFNPVTTIPFTLPSAAVVRLEVVSLVGQTAATLLDGPMSAGMHTVRWDGTDERGVHLSSGVYFYRLVVDRTVVGTRRLVLIK
jgi:hypothetical protein